MATRVAPTKVTGGGGDFFEDQVGAYFMACLLTETPPLGSSVGVLVSLDFQTKASGWLLDDLLFTLSSSGGESRASFSIKSNRQFSQTSAPLDFVETAWEQYLNGAQEFDLERDFLGLISAPHDAKLKNDLDDLLTLVRAQTPSIFADGIGKVGFLSKSKIQLFRSFSCPSHLDQKGTVTPVDTAALLSRIYILEFDFESNNSSSRTNAVESCRSALVSEGLDEAELLWQALVSFAAEMRPRGGHVDMPRLIARLREKFSLKAYRSHRRDWERLNAHTRQILNAIPDKIGQTVSINRQNELTAIEAKFSDANVVVVLGPSGCGKTVIAKTFLEGVLKSGPALWWDAKSFDVPDYISFESKFGLTSQLSDILPAVVGEQPTIVIDAIDRIFLESAFANVSILIRILQTENSAWRVVITCQPEEWERVQGELARVNISVEHWETLNVKEPQFIELKPVWTAFPRLQRLAIEPQLESLLLKPKVLDLLANKVRAGEDVPTQSWVGESDLIDWFWNAEVARGPKATLRSNFLQSLGEKQADDLDVVTAVRDVIEVSQGVVDEVIHDRLCVLNHEQLSFAHELYGDWSRQRILLGKGDQLVKYLKPRLGSPLWNRAVRLYGIHLLESNADVKPWKAAIENVTAEGEDLALDLLLESVIFAANPLPIYERLWPELVSDQGKLLNRLLGRFLHVATVPNPMMLAFAEELDGSDTPYAVMNRLPIWTYWMPMIRVLHNHSEEVIELALVRCAEVANIWLRQLDEEWPLRKEAAELGIAAAEYILDFKSQPHHIIKDNIDHKIFASGLAGARELQERVTKFALTACARIVQPAPTPEVNSQLIRHNVSLGLPWRRRRRALQRWPDGPKGKVDDGFRKVCLTTDALYPLIAAAPLVAEEVILALLIEESVTFDDDEDAHVLRDFLGTSLFWDWNPPLFFNGPFLYFLRHQPEEGVDSIVRFVNFVASVWLSRNPNRGRFLIRWNDEDREWFGNGDMYFWYRDQSNCPDTVVVALMALEKWLYEELDAGRDITPHLQRIISGSNNVAFAGLLSAIGRKQPLLTQDLLAPFFAISAFLIWEKQYASQPHDYLIGWRDKGPRLIKIVQEWHGLSHRQVSLHQMARLVYLNVPGMRPLFEEARARWKEELRGLSKKRSYWRDELEELIEVFTLENYKTEDDKGQKVWAFKPTPQLQTKIEASRKEFDARYPIVVWPRDCRAIINTGKPLPQEQLEDLWGRLQKVSESSPIKGEFGYDIRPEHATCGAIAVFLLLHRDWLRQHPEREAWCINKVTETSLHPPEPGPLDGLRSDGTGLEWSSFCADVLPHLWAENPTSTLLREAIAKLAVDSKFVSVAMLFNSAARWRNTLGENFLQLRNFIHRWAGRMWSDRVAREEIRRSAWENNRTPDEDSPIDSSEWRALAEDFVFGTLTPVVPTFRTILRNLKPRLDPFRGEETPPEFTDLNLSLIQSAYSWLPTLDEAINAEERVEWLSLWSELLDGTCERFKTSDDDDRHGTPYPWDRWVFNRTAGLILEMRLSEHPQAYWEKILFIGPPGHYWIEEFFLSWFRRGLGSEVSESFVREWRKMAERAFTLPQWDVKQRKHLYDHQRIWWHLFGMSQHFVNCWGKNHERIVEGMKDVYERWANTYLEEPMSALQFAGFLRLPAANGIRLQGVAWIERKSAEADEEYWKEDDLQDIVAEVLDKCWASQHAQLRSKSEYFDAFKRLLSRLAALQNRLALEVQHRIAGG